jgi:hypothetical protein
LFKFELMPQDWYKRREKTPEASVIKIDVIGFRKIENSNCIMHVKYDNDEHVTLGAIVQHNPGANRWTVHGLNEQGISVLARLVE